MKMRYTLPLIAFAALTAQAADFKFGVHAGLSLPQGEVSKEDYLDSKMGFTLGANLQFDLGKGHAVTPRLDVTSFSKDHGSGIEYNVTNTTLGADYNYFVGGKVGQGLYLIGGLGFAQVKHEGKAESLSLSDSATALQFALGAGYQFNANLHGELRYTSVETEREFTFMGFSDKEKITSPAISVTVGYRF